MATTGTLMRSRLSQCGSFTKYLLLCGGDLQTCTSFVLCPTSMLHVAPFLHGMKGAWQAVAVEWAAACMTAQEDFACTFCSSCALVWHGSDRVV